MRKLKRFSKYTEEELLRMKRKDIIKGMLDIDVSFCEYYVQSHNETLAAIKSGYKLDSARINARRIRNKQSCIDYLAWLRLHLYQECMVDATDLLNGYAKMAFYDIRDYIEMQGNKIKLKSLDEIDGTIIQEISSNGNGSITVKFPDRMRAFDKLNDFMQDNPYDWKRKIEERKLSILEEKLENEKLKAGIAIEDTDDGFIKALETSAKIFEDDEEEEEDNEV